MSHNQLCLLCHTEVSESEDTTLAEIVEATEEKPSLMPPPPASAFAPSANGCPSIVEELLARQVCKELANILFPVVGDFVLLISVESLTLCLGFFR